MGFSFAEWWLALCWCPLTVPFGFPGTVSLASGGASSATVPLLAVEKSQSEETMSSYSPQKKHSLILHSRGSVCPSSCRYQGRYFSVCSWALLCFFMFCFHNCCHLSQMVISISGTQSCPLSLFFMLDSLPFPRRLQFPHHLLPFSKYLIFLVSCFNFVQHMFLT